MTNVLPKRLLFALTVAVVGAAFLAMAAAAPVVVEPALAKKAKKAKKKVLPKVGPSGLAFYNPWQRYSQKKYRLRSTKPGQVVWTGKPQEGVALENSSATKLILYTSKSVKGKTVFVSGSVSIPEGEAPEGGWPVISYGHGTTGIADKCAPTRDPENGYVAYTDPVLEQWLEAGYAVLRTDYEGLGTPGIHPFIIGTAAGRSMIDIARASRQIGLNLSSRVAFTGHSQGGAAALFAGGIAPNYSPDLDVRGTVGYSPAATLDEYANALPALTAPGAPSNLAALILRGTSSVNSKIVPKTLLNPPAFALFPETLTKCLGELGEPDSYGGLAPASLLTQKATDDLSNYSGPLSLTLAQQQAVFPMSAPVLIPQGGNDTTTPYLFTNILVTELREVNPEPTPPPATPRIGFTLYPGVDHSGILAAAQPDVQPWLDARFAD